MNVHHDARLTAHGRERIVQAILKRELSVKAAVLQSGLSERSVRKWLARYRAEGRAGLRDRSSRPQRSPRETPPAQVAVVLALRRLRLPGFQIARQSALSRATVSRLLRRHGLARLRDLEPAPPVVRYQRQLPGELLHFDIKKLGKIVRPSHRVTESRLDWRAARMAAIGAGRSNHSSKARAPWCRSIVRPLALRAPASAAAASNRVGVFL